MCFNGRVLLASIHQEEMNFNVKGDECLCRGSGRQRPLPRGNRLKEKKVKVETKLTKRGECGRIWREMKSMWVRVSLK